MIKNPTLRRIYKIVCLLMLTYVAVGGFYLSLPRVGGLEQSSRAIFFHLPMWFAMYVLMLFSLGWSIGVLRKGSLKADRRAREAAIVAIFFGFMGLITGILWSRVAWGASIPDTNPNAWWVWDPKQTGALVALLIYLSYLVLRGSIDERRRRARIAAIYNIFATASIFPLTYIIPRQLQGLHPGAESDTVDFAGEYRIVLYPAFIGFILLAYWMYELRTRGADLNARVEAASN
jgi:heme exporter protein C